MYYTTDRLGVNPQPADPPSPRFRLVPFFLVQRPADPPSPVIQPSGYDLICDPPQGYRVTCLVLDIAPACQYLTTQFPFDQVPEVRVPIDVVGVAPNDLLAGPVPPHLVWVTPLGGSIHDYNTVRHLPDAAKVDDLRQE